MITLSENEQNPLDTAEDTPEIKLYKRNGLVNFRLLRAHDDIRALLNEKKRQGVVISEYIVDLIRRAEGLEQPSAAFKEPQQIQAAPQQSTNNTVSLDNLDSNQMDQLLNMLMNKMNLNALSNPVQQIVHETVSAADTQEKDNAAEQRKKAELKALSDDMLDWS